jgi:hypothetical protein
VVFSPQAPGVLRPRRPRIKGYIKLHNALKGGASGSPLGPEFVLVYRFEGVPRNPLSVAIKNVLTLGIHTKVWLYRVNREMDGREGFHINLYTLAVMLWLPVITPAIVKFQTAGRLNQMVADPVTIPLMRARRLGWISLVPVFGAGFYAWWVQRSLNQFWFWHRRKERAQLNKELIKEIAQEEETDASLSKRFELEKECRRIEREMEEEIEAVRLKWGEERFQARKKRADLHAQRGRLSRKEMQEFRKKEQERRKEQRQRRRRERSVLARYLPRRADPEKEELWEPVTPLPQRSPEEILQAAKAEDRELSGKEARELKRAEALIAAREKESQRLEKRRAKLLARVRRKEARLEAQAGKKARKAETKGKKVPAGEGVSDGGRSVPEGLPRRRWLVLPPKRDPEVDAHWQPRTPEPEIDPDEVMLAADTEGRELTKKERKQVERAEKQIEKREKETEVLEKAREKARTKAEKQAVALEARNKKRAEKEARRKTPKKEKAKRSKGEDAASKKRAVKAKKPKRSKAKKQEHAAKADEDPAGGGATTSLRVLRVRCPQCRTEVPVKKPDDRPARLKCPSCGLVGKV